MASTADRTRSTVLADEYENDPVPPHARRSLLSVSAV